MTNDDFLLDQVERDQRHQTRRRHDSRSRRRHLYIVGGLALVFAFLLGAPSLVSHSSIGRSILIQTLSAYGLDANVDSMRIGWVTPLQVRGLSVRGSAGSELTIDQLDMDMTVADLMGSSSNDLGQIAVRGVNVACAMTDGRCSLEDDLQSLLQTSEQENTTTATLKLQDISVSVTDAVSGGTWQIAQSNAEVDLTSDRIQATFSGVLSEPGGSGGSLQGSIELVSAATESTADQWRLDINSESLPLSVVSLIGRRFPAACVSIPRKIHGDATGAVLIVGTRAGAIEASVRSLKVRNLTAADQGSRVWNNGLATLDGDLVLVGNRVIGRRLQATTDFASATINGAFSRTFSLVGANDNPVRWLEAIDGTATAEIDLAAFDRSLPGILPLRDEAQIVSGRVVAHVDSTLSGGARRSKLNLRSEAIRARSHGQAVVIDPIELIATVSSDQGQVRAEQFDWKSTFGSAVGQGDLRAGNADIEIDFGRLTAMLRPIVHISETSLSGTAHGKIQWNASADKTWRLVGSGSVSNLLVTLPSGQSLKRPSMQGEIEAVGRWGAHSLDELTRADVTLASSGLDIQAELIQAVDQPSATTPMPIRIRGNGRVEMLAETLGPWLPTQLQSAAGGFTINARAEVSTLTTRLTSAAIELTEPRVVYADRYFSQPGIKLHFDGDYLWPSHRLQARSFTMAGDAFSIAAQGEASGEQVDLEIKWRAKLERIQGSVKKRIAAQSVTTVQQVGFRPGAPIKSEEWMVMGDCEGAFVLTTRDRSLDIETHATGKDVAVIQPPTASARSQTVGPMPRPPSGNQSTNPDHRSQVVWSEPNLKIDGVIRYDASTGTAIANGVQVAGDWFATTLSGGVLWNQTTGDVRLDGPARLKMNEVAQRLSSLTAMDIRAEGIQETPVQIRASRTPTGDIALSVVGNLGWEAAQIAGVTLGPALVPVRLTETSVDVSRSRIPVGQGHLNLAGQVHYRPGPLWVRIEPGVVADSIRLTPEMTDRWLKYLAPLAADTGRIDGTMGAEIDEALIVFDQPEQSRVTGRLNIGGVQMSAGPLANQILGGVQQLKSLFQGVSPQATGPSNRTLISMPVQTVGFAVDHGLISHDRLFFEVDRAQVVTSGRVGFDGRLNMIAQIPLDARWLGNDLQGLAGQPVSLPIDGTLSRPSLDSSGVRQVVAQLGVQAAQNAVQNSAENYLQKQLNRSLDKVFGR